MSPACVFFASFVLMLACHAAAQIPVLLSSFRLQLPPLARLPCIAKPTLLFTSHVSKCLLPSPTPVKTTPKYTASHYSSLLLSLCDLPLLPLPPSGRYSRPSAVRHGLTSRIQTGELGWRTFFFWGGRSEQRVAWFACWHVKPAVWVCRCARITDSVVMVLAPMRRRGCGC